MGVTTLGAVSASHFGVKTSTYPWAKNHFFFSTSCFAASRTRDTLRKVHGHTETPRGDTWRLSTEPLTPSLPQDPSRAPAVRAPAPSFISQRFQTTPGKMNSSCSPDIKQALQQAPNTRGPVLCLIRCQVLVSPPAISRYHSADSRGGRQKSNLNKYSIFPPLFFHAALYAQTTPPTFFFIYFFFSPFFSWNRGVLVAFLFEEKENI